MSIYLCNAQYLLEIEYAIMLVSCTYSIIWDSLTDGLPIRDNSILMHIAI